MIRVQVRAIGVIGQAMGASEWTPHLEPGATVGELLRHLVQQHGPPLARWLTDSDGSPTTSYTRVLVNGRDLFVLDDVETTLKHGDVVSLIPIVAGGH